MKIQLHSSFLIVFIALTSCADVKSDEEKVIVTPITQSSTDSMSRYTYQVFKLAPDAETFASGFFFRKNENLYFITNYHVAANWDMIKDSISPGKYTELHINIPGYGVYNTGINPDSLAHTRRSYVFYKQPDIFVIPINNLPPTAKIFSIENFIANDTPQRSDELFAYGFGDAMEQFEKRQQPNAVKRSGTLNHEFNILPLTKLDTLSNVRGKKHIDSVNYYAGLQLKPGDSGSPTFFNKNGRLIFCGVVNSYSGGMKAALIVRPDIVLRIVD